MFDHIAEGPLPLLALPIFVEEGLEPLSGVPLQIIGQQADEHMGSDPLVLFMIHRSDF